MGAMRGTLSQAWAALGPSLAVAAVTSLALLSVPFIACSESSARDEQLREFVRLVNLGTEGDYLPLESPSDAVANDAVLLGRLRDVKGTVSQATGQSGPPLPYLVVEVEIERVIARRTDNPALESGVVTMLVLYSPLVDEQEIVASFPKGVETLVVLADGRADGFLRDHANGFGVLPSGPLFYPHPTGVWFRQSDGGLTGLQPREELEANWGPIADFDALVAMTEEAAKAVRSDE